MFSTGKCVILQKALFAQMMALHHLRVNRHLDQCLIIEGAFEPIARFFIGFFNWWSTFYLPKYFSISNFATKINAFGYICRADLCFSCTPSFCIMSYSCTPPLALLLFFIASLALCPYVVLCCVCDDYGATSYSEHFKFEAMFYSNTAHNQHIASIFLVLNPFAWAFISPSYRMIWQNVK